MRIQGGPFNEDLCQQTRVDVSARQDGDPGLGGRQVTFAQQARGHCHRSTGLGYQMRLHRQPPHRLAYLVLGDGHDVIHVPEDVLQRHRADLFYPQRVSDGPLRVLGRPGDLAALPQRVACVGCQFRLHPDHLRPRAQGGDGGSNTGDQATTADRNHDQIGPGAISRDLQADSALPGDNRPVVKGRDERVSVLTDQFLGGRHARGQRGLSGYDPRAEPAGRSHLDGRRVVRNNDRGRHAEKGCCVGNCLSVIAAGMGYHPPFARRARKCADGGIGAAQLEGTGQLQRFGLDQQAGPGAGERQQRSPDGDPRQAVGCSPDFFDRYQRRHPPTL